MNLTRRGYLTGYGLLNRLFRFGTLFAIRRRTIVGRNSPITKSKDVREELDHARSHEKDRGADFDSIPRDFNQGGEHPRKPNSDRDQRSHVPGNPSS